MNFKLKSIFLNRKLLNSIFVFVIVFLLFTKKERITGEIRVVGTSLFYDLVITTEERDYYFDKKFFEEYSKYEGEIITIEAKVKKTKLWLADRSRYLERYNILWVKKVD
ncbi:hypothetical protein [Brachyspira sp.]|uniref:hypothetical protein n=1 Tax=Brachyspira sp. TaxID=1977261 RepID=UPI003D7DA34E